MNNLEQLTFLADKFKVSEVAKHVLANPKFPVWSGSSKPNQHHYGKGGLLKHTAEVIKLCLNNNEYFIIQGKGVNESQLFLAALFHDAGKMWDYEPVQDYNDPFDDGYTNWKGCDHKRKIHHISRSALVWQEASDQSTEGRDEILHAILAHHGCREWGSPVSPATRMAWLLHLCDGLSARMDDVYTLERLT